jgi:Fur family peroxide stress response transcriptional regulator
VKTTEQAEELRHALQRAGLRCTRQRAAVWSYLRSVESHPTTDQVFRAVRREIPSISLATVYNALEALVDARLANRVAAGPGPARYDGRSDAHYHLRCEVTGEVRDLPLSYDPQLPDKLDPALMDRLRSLGFEVTGHHLELVGRFPSH